MYYLQIKAILFGDLAVQVKQIDVFPNYRHGIALKEMTVHASEDGSFYLASTSNTRLLVVIIFKLKNVITNS